MSEMEDIREKMVNFVVKCGKELMAEKYNNSANNLTSPKLMKKALDDIFLHITEQINEYVENKGKIFACGTCLVSRNKEGSPICPMSTMNDLMDLVEQSDKIVSF